MLPVAELHVHIEGTLEPELLVKLAARNGTWMPVLDVDELRAMYRFDGLKSFLGLYYANLRVLKIEPGLLRPGPRVPGPRGGRRGAPGRDLLRPADAPGQRGAAR